MEIIYKAKDGKEFDNEDDCDVYEHRFLYECPLPLFLDKNFKTVPLEDVECTENVQYILCRNKQEYDNMVALFNYLCIEAPDEKWIEGNGYCLWSWGWPNLRAYGWVNVTKQIFAMEDVCDRAIDCLQDECESEVK